jgi:mRNA-degrading endonuclease toxin of MazEF toxin-antitoxin module
VAGRETLKRGDIRWYRFPFPNKRRPVLMLGQETVLRSASEIPVIPLSTQVRGLPWEVLLGPEEGFQVPSVLKPEWIRSVPRVEIGPWICTFPAERWDEVRAAVVSVLGLDVAPL